MSGRLSCSKAWIITMQRFIFACLALVLSTQLMADALVRVHWPLTEYMSLVRAEAKELVMQNGAQVGLAFPTLIVFSKSGQLIWMGKPIELATDVVNAANRGDESATIDVLGKVLSALDNARNVYPVVGFEQVSGAPSTYISRTKPTAILVVANFSCEGCASMIESSIQSIPKDWNKIAATVTLSQ